MRGPLRFVTQPTLPKDSMNETSLIVPGAVVWLKSGSPPLTVMRLSYEGDIVYVTWAAGDGRIDHATLPIAGLTIEPTPVQKSEP
jgi:hypothetical protein